MIQWKFRLLQWKSIRRLHTKWIRTTPYIQHLNTHAISLQYSPTPFYMKLTYCSNWVHTVWIVDQNVLVHYLNIRIQYMTTHKGSAVVHVQYCIQYSNTCMRDHSNTSGIKGSVVLLQVIYVTYEVLDIYVTPLRLYVT